MADDEKAKLYKEIVRRTSDAFLLDRMRTHGFWPEKEPLPKDPPDELSERAKIEAELQKLKQTSLAVKDPEKALAEEQKRRWEESKKRRKEAKEKREAEQKARSEAWAKVRKQKVVHLGLGVSKGLEDTKSDAEKLLENGLPVLHTSADVASMLGVSLPVLRWLTYHRKSVALVHYHRYGIPKKTGGIRNISAPKKSLSAAQEKVLVLILEKIAPEPQAHGFVAGRSILTNAAPHAGRKVVMNLDLRDFFPTITFRRVKGLFHKLGYSEHAATVLALLCTEPARAKAELSGRVYHVALGERFLPQGTCTSPAITNLLCRRLDKRLSGLAQKAGFLYTRYADDLTFSGDDTGEVGRLLRAIRKVITSEGFEEHAKKTRVMRRGRRQEVTGLIVNSRPAVPREEIRRLRAILHNAARSGLDAQNRENVPDFAAHLRGRVAFVEMVDKERGEKLRAALNRVLAGR
ncbi:MAG: RNA-directed DNA polymerase [Polyangiaceae bacterium]|nr:RNA-directed DNA polymerase [Polyangiaceae bacterium]